ncbi:hypothetical protein JOQ06_023771, partial [Pogonophryne albipinna]
APKLMAPGIAYESQHHLLDHRRGWRLPPDQSCRLRQIRPRKAIHLDPCITNQRQTSDIRCSNNKNFPARRQ